MDIDSTEQPSEPSVQPNDSIHPHTPAIPHASTATATQSSCPSSPPSKKVNEDDDACFDISPEQKRQRALDKGKGRMLYDETSEAPVTIKPIDTIPTATDQQEQETKKIVEEEDRSPTPTPAPAVSSRRRYRPILTLRSSHGWVWNQVCILFTPPACESRIDSNALLGPLCPDVHEGPLHRCHTRAPEPHI